MDAALLSRIQFAMTAGFHFLFPPLTIGLSWIIFWMLTKYRSTGIEVWRRMARFWFGLFSLSFAIGVATGITLEFQFGTNWSQYSRFVGDIFGAPLAAEALFSFFLESTFMGVMLFGWDRLSKNTMWFASLMVAFGSSLSALWIIIANSWMQTPAGYAIRNGRAELTDFFAAALNPSTLPRYTHVIAASLATGAFFVMGISAYFLVKKRHEEPAGKSLKVSLVIGLAAALLTLGFGHWHGVQVAETQPLKLASIEGLFETRKPAPGIIFAVPDVKEERSDLEISVPAALSFLIYGDLHAEVKGLKAFPKSDWPPVLMTFYSFHLMVAMGMAMIALTLLGIYLMIRKKLFSSDLYLKILMYSIPLPFLATQLGWITAEVGRQPWAVYQVIKTKDAFSPTVPAGQILLTIILFALVYSLLFALWIFLLRRKVLRGPETEPKSKKEA